MHVEGTHSTEVSPSTGSMVQSQITEFIPLNPRITAICSVFGQNATDLFSSIAIMKTLSPKQEVPCKLWCTLTGTSGEQMSIWNVTCVLLLATFLMHQERYFHLR